MGRPPEHDVDRLLDAAAQIAAAEGGAGVSAAAVARAAGAPSGSLYHRFENRAFLLAELWLRTVSRFQAGVVKALAGEDPVEACVAAARHVVAWSRENPREARILQQGPGEFGRSSWSPELRRRERSAARELEASLRETAASLDAGSDDAALQRVLLVVVDLPQASVKRALSTGRGRIPAGTEELVEESARALLAPR
jgi:AcrR family transcriptional regulator